MTHSFWQHAVWIDFFHRKEAKWSDLLYFVTSFNNILEYNDEIIERLYEEFIDYKTINVSELPGQALTDAPLKEYKNSDEYRLDMIWYHLYQMKSLVGNNYRFRLLFNVARLALVTPHSNAGIERVYALVNKNKSEGCNRNRLDIDGSLSAILAVKLDRPESFTKCYDFKPSEKLLVKAKKATTKYNSMHL